MSLNSRLLKLKGRICPHHPEHDSSLSLFAGCDNYQVIHSKWLATHVQEKRICSLLRTIIAVGKDCGESGDWREKRERKYFATTFRKTRGKQRKTWSSARFSQGEGPSLSGAGQLGQAGPSGAISAEKHRVRPLWRILGPDTGPGDIYIYLGSIINIMMNLGELFVKLSWVE